MEEAKASTRDSAGTQPYGRPTATKEIGFRVPNPSAANYSRNTLPPVLPRIRDRRFLPCLLALAVANYLADFPFYRGFFPTWPTRRERLEPLTVSAFCVISAKL